MKRNFLFSLLAAAVILALCVSTSFAEAQLNYVSDWAGLFTEDENRYLEETAASVSKEFSIGVYIVTVDDYQSYGTGDVFETTYGIYHEYTMGEGENRDGIMLLISIAERDWAMFCYGERCEYAFNDYAQEKLEAAFIDNFNADDWYGGFTDYIEECKVYLQKAAVGEPVRESPAFYIIVMAVMSLFAAFIIVGTMWKRMNSVAKEKTAAAYVSGNLNLLGQSDTFTYRTETRHKIESSSSGSHSRSGGGGSGRSGKF